MGFSRQEYWTGLPFPSPGDLPDPVIEPGSPALQQMLYCLSHQGSFTFIKRLFNSSSLPAIRVVSFAYLRLLIFLPTILIPAWALYRVAFHMTYSANKLNNQGDNIEPWCNPFPIWNKSVVPCLILTVASWPAYRFLWRKVGWSGIPITLRMFHSLLWSTVKGFSIVNEAEVCFSGIL